MGFITICISSDAYNLVLIFVEIFLSFQLFFSLSFFLIIFVVVVAALYSIPFPVLCTFVTRESFIQLLRFFTFFMYSSVKRKK